MYNFKMLAGDIVIGNDRNIALVSDDDEIVQAIEEILNVNAGEWFLNDEHGLRRYDILGKKRFSEDEIKNTINAALFQETRINEVRSLNVSFDRKARKLAVIFEVAKQDQTVINGEVILNVNG